ncbi:MAG: putative Ig domain-containing protein [Patescibacteria group bacterium]|nr:putative Ig domain-containing protein [Patescibacteria group bacterium]
MKKIVVAFGLFFLAFVIPVTVYSLISNSTDFDIRDQAAESETDESNVSTPQIVSIPVTLAYVGQDYKYIVRAVDEEGDELTYYIRTRPRWATWNSELKTLEGRPGSNDTGTNDVEIEVSDGKWLTTQTFQVEVVVEDESEETSGLGGSGADPDDIHGGSGSIGSNETDEVYSEHGLYRPSSESEVHDSASQQSNTPVQSVLGAQDTQLPQTAIFSGIVGFSLGAAILTVALYLSADAKWDITNRLFTKYRFECGQQIGLTGSEGVIVKRKKSRLTCL